MKKPVEDWLFLAQCDIDAAELIVSEDHLTGIAAFLCQQMQVKPVTSTVRQRIRKDTPLTDRSVWFYSLSGLH